MLARELNNIYSIFRDIKEILIRLKEMKLKMSPKSSDEQDSPKDAEIKTEAISSTRGRRKVGSSYSELNDFTSGSKMQTKGNKKIAHKIMTARSVSSQSNATVKELQIKLARCDEEDIKLCNGSEVLDANSKQFNEKVKSKAKNGKESLKKAHKKNMRKENNIPGSILEVSEDGQNDGDVEMSDTSGVINNSRLLNKAKAKSMKKGERLKKNSNEDNKGIDNISGSVPEAAENGQKNEDVDVSDAVVSNSKPVSKARPNSIRGKRLKKNSSESNKGIDSINKSGNISRSILEVTKNKQTDEDVLTSDVVVNDSKLLIEAKPKSSIRGKRLKKNSSEDIKVKNDPDKIENGQSDENYHNGDATNGFQIKLKRCDNFIIENLETLKTTDNLELSLDVAKDIKSVPNQKGTKRKRGGSGNKDKSDGDIKPVKSAKKDKNSDKSKSSKEKIPDVTALDFSNNSQSPSGSKWNFKIASWNVNGIRAWLEKNGLSYLHHEKPDIICVQETKCSDDKLPREVKEIEGYHAYWLSGDKDGYSGVGLLSKEEPIKIDYGIGISEHDNEGRVITAEYEKFFLVSTYVPNAGRKLVRLEYRMKWDKDFREYLKILDAKKPVILCGDLNVAHEEIDLANPKTNKKNAGFTKEEREGFSALLSEGFIDTFRQLYPDVTGAYTFWTYMMNARAKNVGWRLDYFVLSERFRENLCDSVIRKNVFGSDHCPIALFLSI